MIVRFALWMSVFAVAVVAHADPSEPRSKTSDLTNKVQYTCDSTAAAQIPAADVGGARLLGTPKYSARALQDASWFDTYCPVLVTKIPAPSSSCIPTGATIFKFDGEAMTITSSGNDFKVLFEGGSSGKDALDMSWGATNSDPPFDFLSGVDAAGREFFVYLQDSFEPGDLSMLKKYWIHLYYPDPNNKGHWVCEDEMPDKGVTNGTGDPPIIPKSGMRQGGVGGGTEPSHHQ